MYAFISSIKKALLHPFITINIMILCVFFGLALYVAISPASNNFGLYESPIPVFVIAMALIAGLSFVTEMEIPSFVRRHARLISGIGLVALLAVELIIAHALRSYGYDWDSDLIYKQAVSYATTGTIAESSANYFAIYPNNIALLSILGGLFKFLHHFKFDDFLSAAILLNVFLMFMAQLFTYLSVKELYGRRLAAIAMVFSFVFISLSMYIQIPYTDTLSVAFPIMLLYMALRFYKATRLASQVSLAFLIGITTYIGYAIKPTVAIAFIVLIFVAACKLGANYRQLRKGNRTPVKVAVVSVTVCMIAITGASTLFTMYVDNLAIVPFPKSSTSSTSMPLIHFYSMGLKTTPYKRMTVYGGFYPQEAATAFSLDTKQARTDYSKKLIRQRLSNYGPLGYANFLVHKANWVMSDATFYAYGEGSNAKVVFTSKDRLSRSIREFMYIGGARYTLFANFLQIFWIALLMLIAAQLLAMVLDTAARQDVLSALPRFMIAGIVLFLLLFEARSRYIFLYVPVFIVAAMGTLHWFKNSKSLQPHDMAND